MPDWSEVVVPQLGVNDDRVRLVAWRACDGDPVQRGQVIAEAETSKAAVELVAENAGYLFHLAREGAELPIRAAVALITAIPDPALRERYKQQHAHIGEADGGEVQLTAKARLLAESLGLDIAALPASRILREEDIRALLPAAIPAATPVPESGDAVIFGASQGGLVVAEAMRSTGRFRPVAFIDDDASLAGGELEGLPIWDAAEMAALGARGIVGIGTHVARPAARLALRTRAAEAGIALLNVVHARAWVAPTASMGSGNLIKAGAIVEDYVVLEDCIIIDNGAIIPHHNRIASGCHIAPGAAMGGDCTIGAETIVGVGAVLAPRLTIGRRCIIGAGAVVSRDLPDNTVVEAAAARITSSRP